MCVCVCVVICSAQSLDLLSAAFRMFGLKSLPGSFPTGSRKRGFQGIRKVVSSLFRVLHTHTQLGGTHHTHTHTQSHTHTPLTHTPHTSHTHTHTTHTPHTHHTHTHTTLTLTHTHTSHTEIREEIQSLQRDLEKVAVK